MTKHKVSELEGALLDAAVAKAEGWTRDQEDPDGWWSPDGKMACSITERGIASGYGFHPAHFWSDGGPIIERERIATYSALDRWSAVLPDEDAGAYLGNCDYIDVNCMDYGFTGPTPLIAAMRAFVASKLGEEVELP